MWADNETDLDLLGFRVHAELVRSIVTDPKLLPVTLGVFADWGGGKTSLMKILAKSLEPESWPVDSPERAQCKRTACLYFNGWTFEGYDDAKAAILSSVLVALGEHKRFGPKVRAKCASLLKSVNWMRVASLGLKHVAVPAIAAYATGGASVVPGVLGSLFSSWWPSAQKTTTEPPGGQAVASTESTADTKGDAVDWEDLIKKDQSPSGPLDVRSFREQFGKLLKESDIDSLVVLIDDLDRCSPERIIENLEAIKLFLNVEHTAFVIGADPRIVRHAIAWKYSQHGAVNDGDDRGASDRLVTDYLEKLIQYPYRLPRLSPSEIETYMALLFCQLNLSEPLFQKTVEACDQQRGANRYAVFGSGAVEHAIKGDCEQNALEALSRSLAFCTSAAPLVTEGLKGNPRQVKRFLNALIMRKKLAEVAKLSNIDDAVLVKLMILEYSHENRFRELYDWQAAHEGVAQQLTILEEAFGAGKSAEVGPDSKVPEGWDTGALRRWVAMPPPLAGIDLRDFFWVARDKLQTTLSGISMVPPFVRRVFESLTSDNPAKKKAGVVEAGKLDPGERAILFRLLDQQILQKPQGVGAYEGFRLLVDADVPDAAGAFAKVLGAVTPGLVPPPVAMSLNTLLTAKPDLNTILGPALTRIRGSDSRAGVAAKGAKGTKR